MWSTNFTEYRVFLILSMHAFFFAKRNGEKREERKGKKGEGARDE